MSSVNAYASNVFDNPPQKQWGQTKVDESCRNQGVSYERKETKIGSHSVTIRSNDRSDVNMTVERKDGTSYSIDTRSGWTGSNNTYDNDRYMGSSDNVDIKCYPRNQK